MSGVSSFWDLKCQFILSFAKRDCLLDCVVTPSLDPGENPAAGQPVSFFRCSTGDFPSRQASRPPLSGRTRWIPFFLSSIAVRALEISSGEVQWRISRSRGLSWCRYSTSSSEKLSATGCHLGIEPGGERMPNIRDRDGIAGIQACLKFIHGDLRHSKVSQKLL